MSEQNTFLQGFGLISKLALNCLLWAAVRIVRGRFGPLGGHCNDNKACVIKTIVIAITIFIVTTIMIILVVLIIIFLIVITILKMTSCHPLAAPRQPRRTQARPPSLLAKIIVIGIIIIVIVIIVIIIIIITIRIIFSIVIGIISL